MNNINFDKIKKIFSGKKILITGHTGFKGSWLSLWLIKCGAKIYGISKDIPTAPSHYKELKLSKELNEYFFKIQNQKKCEKVIKKIKPDFIFHLAAQSIVKKSYINPSSTWYTNFLGTMSLIETLRRLKIKKNLYVILITSDKAYKNLELKRGYQENDVLGGEDPYSASKGSAEILINSYVKCFFKKSKIKFAVARAGNVIGGGDWSYERLIPDCIKSWSKNKNVILRSPNSIRPWQHVIEVLYGYLKLSYYLKNRTKLNGEAFNFGPSNKSKLRVIELVKIMKNNWKKVNWKLLPRNKTSYKETKLLSLNSNKARKKLNWRCILTSKQTIKMVSDWYRSYYTRKVNVKNLSIKQINYYEKKLLEKNK